MAKEQAIKVQQVMDTIQQFEMKPTYDNCNHMLGCLQALAEIREYLMNVPATEEAEGAMEEEHHE